MVEITYHKEGDYFIPDLFLEKEEYAKDYNIGKYGHLRLEYLKNHKKAEYIIMFMNKTLRKHIVETGELDAYVKDIETRQNDPYTVVNTIMDNMLKK